MSADVRAAYFGGAETEPAGADAETGIVFTRSDAQAPSPGTAPIPKPDDAGNNFSYIMLLGLEVETGDDTSLSNRSIRFEDDTIATGLHLYFADQDTYRQPGSANKPTDEESDDTVPTPAGDDAPSAYTEVTDTAQVWDAGSDSASSTGRNGNFVELVLGVSSDFAGGGGQAALPDIIIAYDEA